MWLHEPVLYKMHRCTTKLPGTPKKENGLGLNLYASQMLVISVNISPSKKEKYKALDGFALAT